MRRERRLLVRLCDRFEAGLVLQGTEVKAIRGILENEEEGIRKVQDNAL